MNGWQKSKAPNAWSLRVGVWSIPRCLGVVVADPQIATATPGSLEEMTLLNLFCVALSASTAIFPDAPNVRIRPARSSTPATLPATSSKPFSKRTPDQDVAYTKHEFRRSQQCA